MPLVKLTIRAEPQEVDDGELAILRGQNLVERVIVTGQETAVPGSAAEAAGQPAGTDQAAPAADGKE